MEEEAAIAISRASPELEASLLSRLTWRWMEPLLSLGNKRPLKMEDLYQLNPKETTSSCELRWNECFQAESSKRVWRVLLRFVGQEYFLASLLRPLWLAFMILQVYTLKSLVSLVQRSSSDGKLEWWRAALLVLGMFFLPGLQSSCQINMFFLSFRMGIRVRAAVSMAIFNKMMGTKMVALGSSSGSLMLNIIANDTQKLVDGITFFHYLWMPAIHLPVVSALVMVEAGISALPGILLIFLAQPIQMKLVNHIKWLRRKTVPITDARLGIVSEVLMGIRTVKFNGWTSVVLEKIGDIRIYEIGWIKSVSYIRALMSAFRDGSIPLACVATFGVYAARHGKLDPATAFAVLSFYGILGRDLVALFTGLPHFAEALVAIERIQKLLDPPNGEQTKFEAQTTEISETSCVEVSDCTFSWDIKSYDLHSTKKSSQTTTSDLKQINLIVEKGKSIALTGRIGSGKSSVLLGLLGEMEVLQGWHSATKEVAYAPQQPWILNDTVRGNILFGATFDATRYNSVILACALEQDISALVDGDNTQIGERGVNLSGGQKARLSLARACYSKAPLVLLDDPFSAVDVPTASHLVRHVLGGILKGRTVVISTHLRMCLHACNEVYLMENNTLRLVAKNSVEENETVLEEEGAGDQDLDIDYQPSETERSRPTGANLKTCKSSMGALVKEETRMTGNVRLSNYMEYAQMAGWPLCVAVVIGFLLGQAAFVMVDYWLRVWTDEKYNLPKHVYLVCFASFAIGATLFSLFRAVLFCKAAVTAATNMHKTMTEKVLRSPPLFFDQNPTGRILNRFSKDQAVTDEILPALSQQMVEYLAACSGGMVIIAVLVPWFLLAIPPFLIALVYFRQRYAAVCNELKRLDGISRSPIYAHFSETLQGVVSIRAYGAQARFHDKFVKLIDANHKAFILYVHASRWLGVRLDFTTTVCITVVAVLVVLLRHSISPGLAGVVLVQSFKLTDIFQYAIRVTAEVENHFTSVERIQEYCHLSTEAEPHSKPGTISDEWPVAGRIEFFKYTMAYREDLPPVLNEISFKVEPMEKVGILGRTGAGKSSLVAAIFRMVENNSCRGSIVIDGIDIKLVGLDDLRQRLSIIPQEPILLGGTVRFNLDPFEKYEDCEIYEALERAHLLGKVKSLDGGLDGQVAGNGDNFSIGERQLLCLARSLLRKSRVLILDEATAAVDGQTDQAIQATVRSVFQACTVLTIAHRINTVIDSDRVLVLGKGGRVAEFDTPINLLRAPGEGGIFASMVAHSGKAVAAQLVKAAEDAECSLLQYMPLKPK